jgi:hypothetical protein
MMRPSSSPGEARLLHNVAAAEARCTRIRDLASGMVGSNLTWACASPNGSVSDASDSSASDSIYPRVLGLLHPGLLEIPHFIMERRVLRGIRECAESGHLARCATPMTTVPPMSL